MNLDELGRVLDALGIAPKVLALGARADYSFCVEPTDDGHWEVFWFERGAKNDLVRLHDEATACFQLLGRLCYTQLLAGVIGKV